MVKRSVLVCLGALLLCLLSSGVALGWTPQDIYDDFAQNGKLTRDYTDAELRAYLNDATIAMYADQDVKDRLDDAVMELLNRETFPFTGFQILMAVIVVVVLVGGGVALRLFTRNRRSSEEA